MKKDKRKSLLRRVPRGRDGLASGVAVAALALLAGFISLPLIGLLLWTVDESSWRAITSPEARDALLLSIKTTSIAMIVIIAIGTPAAYLLARASFPGKRILDSLIDLPAVLPPSAAGIALLLTFGRMGLIGKPLGLSVTFTTVAVIVAQVFVSAHFYVRQAAVGFSQVGREPEEAALVDGAGLFGAFARVTLPLSFPALLAGAVTAWARALGEFGATIIFAGSLQGTTETIPLAIYNTLQKGDFDAAVALSVLVLGFAFAVMLVARFLTRRAAEFKE